jgi:putative ABC transport system permease protein
MAVAVAFAALSIVLAAVGLYGVLAYAVAQRRRELGVRTALGASRSALVTLVVREGLVVTAAGALLGLVAGSGVTRLMAATLFGVTPHDVVAFAAAPLILLPIALAACVIPAARAASVVAAEALRRD